MYDKHIEKSFWNWYTNQDTITGNPDFAKYVFKAGYERSKDMFSHDIKSVMDGVPWIIHVLFWIGLIVTAPIWIIWLLMVKK